MNRDRFASVVSSLIVRDSGHRFTGEDFRSLLNPCVYLFMLNGLPLYIGVSKHGITRASDQRHHMHFKARLECDEVLIYQCNSSSDALELETIMIRHLHPKYNRVKNLPS